jgi:hypothetical protein
LTSSSSGVDAIVRNAHAFRLHDEHFAVGMATASFPTVSLVIGEPPERLGDRIVKLIPGEVVLLHSALGALGAVRGAPWARWAILVGGVGLAMLDLFASARTNRSAAHAGQYVIRGAVYLAWAVTVDPRWLQLGNAWMPALALVLVPCIGAFLFPPLRPPR